MSIPEGFSVQIEYHLKSRMAGEKEVFRISPGKDKCYKHVEATRSVYVGAPLYHRYYSTKEPVYVGRHIKTVRDGYGDGSSTTAHFSRNGKNVEVPYSYEGNTCFEEVDCEALNVPTAGGGSKSSRKTRKLNRKSKKSRGRGRK